MEKWRTTVAGNEILDSKDEKFFISYNPFVEIGGFFRGLSMFGSDGGSAETALVIRGKKKNKYLILNGDFRKEYEDVISKGLTACKKVYAKYKKEHNSSWSSK